MRRISKASSRSLTGWTVRLLLLGLFCSLMGVLAAPPAEAQTVLRPGDRGDQVAALQRMLGAKGFYRGPIDGHYGLRVEHAVIAFHKEIRAERTNQWRHEDWELLARYAQPWLPSRSGEPDRVEINITAQVLYLIKNHALVAIVPISSGNGELYQTGFGSLGRANTPRGDFKIQRHIDGWRTSYLGVLYRPWYFIGGYALHGSPSVPAFPASHGCVRVPMWEADYLTGQLYVGMPLHVWDAPAGPGPTFFDEPDSSVYQPPFVDDEGNPHEGNIGVLARSGLTDGCSRFGFCPEHAVTRGQMAAFLDRALDLPDGPDAFSDDDGSLFEPHINALAAAGISKGCGDGHFCPDGAVTRGEMAALLTRALDLPTDDVPNPFWDDNGTQFETDINALAAAGITTGCFDQQFCPNEVVTRAQMATFLVRGFDLAGPAGSGSL